MSQPLWAISGRFAGHLNGDQVYDANGTHAGYLRGDVIYGTGGRVVGELFNEDTVGKRTNMGYPVGGALARHASIASGRYANRAGATIAGWNDPDF